MPTIGASRGLHTRRINFQLSQLKEYLMLVISKAWNFHTFTSTQRKYSAYNVLINSTWALACVEYNNDLLDFHDAIKHPA